LEPTSDKKFFREDYTWDKRPTADKHYVFDHPYPAVQDSGDFDRDFVKDENSDGGKWEAQMEYDTLRSKIRAEKEKLGKLKQNMEKEYEHYQQSKQGAESNHDEVAKAKKDVDAAKRGAEEAVKKVNDLEGGSQADGTKTGGAIGRAIGDVNKEMDDLEKCKEALSQAKEKLKKLLKQRAADEAKAKESKTQDAKAKEAKKTTEGEKTTTEDEKTTADEEKEKEEDEEKEKKSEKKQSNSGKDVEEKGKQEERGDQEGDENKFTKEVQKDTKTVSDAKNNYLKELEEVKQTERQLEEAAKTLKKFRRPPYVDGNGGVYNVPDSFAMMRTQPSLLLVLFAMFLVGRA